MSCREQAVVGATDSSSWSVRAMATEVRVTVPGSSPSPRLAAAVDAALGTFVAVDRSCTRFDPESPLMRANASPSRWHRVPADCFAAIAAAHAAYQRTRGVFDPRILRDLVDLGYDRSFPSGQGQPVSLPTRSRPRRRTLGAWRPRFRGATGEVLIGDDPVDLGGIGKGLAIRWAARRLTSAARDHLVEAGGDCFCAGVSGEGTPWRIAVEDPLGGPVPVAVLALSGRACATSSVRVRSWQAGGRSVHHLLDARSGRPGGEGLRAVTVVGMDPAASEVWSKTLFLAGERGVSAAAERRGLAALWVSEDGHPGFSRAMEPYVVWRR
jgi:thiamine biosynthesis lipoprotein